MILVKVFRLVKWIAPIGCLFDGRKDLLYKKGGGDVFDLKKAAAFQARLASRLDLNWYGGEVKLVAGADCSYDSQRKKIGAAVVVMEIPGFSIVEVSKKWGKLSLPYIPGYLNFREGPVFLQTLRDLKTKPDVTLIDGNGIAHPRQMGLASYVGVLLDISTIGCAKSAFFPYTPPRKERGAFTAYKNKLQEDVGFCLRTRSAVRPLFVSPGNKIDFQMTKKCVLDCSRFRIPEPLRRAHAEAKEMFRRD